MYAQLQARYPTASLVSELLQVQAGNFVVRVVVQVGGITLTTGMAASPSIEQAEDQARLRALAVLDIYPPPAASQAHLIGQPEATVERLRQALPNARSPLPLEESGWNQPSFEQRLLDRSSAETAQSQGAAASTPPPADFDLPHTHPDSPYAGPKRFESTSEVSGNDRGRSSSNYLVGQGNNGKAASVRSEHHNGRSAVQPSRATPQANLLPTPIDLSETIAQTSVELKRLGWSNDQGRSYLQRTYGKRSRSSLTDEELLEFLQYLQAQASADEPSF